MTAVLSVPWEERALHAPTPWEATGQSAYSQTQRFLTVLRWANPAPGETLLDWGCGPGHLAAFVPESVNYIGYDPCPAMVERARVDQPTRRFVTRPDLIDVRVDHVVAVGAWTRAEENTVEHAYEEMRRLWLLTERSLVASLYRGSDARGNTWDADDLAVFAAGLSRRFAVDATHLDNDLIVVVRR